MNNEDKRFKQINRIATPIKVDENGKVIEENIPLKEKTPTSNTKNNNLIKKRTINKLYIIKSLIFILFIGILVSSIYLLIPDSKYNPDIKYNDITTNKPTHNLETYTFESINLNEFEYLVDGVEYTAGSFTIKCVNNMLYVNNLFIGNHSLVNKTVALIDDLIILIASSNTPRSTMLYAISASGEKVLELYHVGDINGMVIDSVVFNRTSFIITTKNVLNDNIIPNNTINNIVEVPICDSKKLFENSIEIEKPVIVNYSYEYNGNHEFKGPVSIHEVSLEKYKKDNNYCQ